MRLAAILAATPLVTGLLVVVAPPAGAATLVVPDSIATVGGALALATAGDTVLVRPGTYVENIELVDGVRVVGENDPVLDGSGSGVVVTSDGCGVTTLLQGFVIRNGAGAGTGGGVFLTSSEAVIYDCRFENNTAMNGGGLGSEASSCNVFACEFENNTATQSGGAVSVTGSASPALSACTMKSNSAPVGGAIAVRNGATPSITNCLVTENVSDQGAIWYDFLTGGLLGQSTIVFNDSNGTNGASLFLNALSSPSVQRNILAFDVSGAATFAAGGASAVFGCNDSFGNPGGDALLGGADVGGNISADPLFCDSDGGDFTLLDTSPCLPGGTCPLIGALGSGCSAISTSAGLEPSSWGRIKARFRPGR